MKTATTASVVAIAAGSGQFLTRTRLSTPSAPTIAKSPTARLRMLHTRYQTETQTAKTA